MKRTYRVLLLLVISFGIPAYAVFGLSDGEVTGQLTAAAGRSPAGAEPSSLQFAMPAVLQCPGETPDEPMILSGELKRLLLRLRELGATYYRLEAIGDESQYRFICEMPNKHQPSEPRVLRATGTQPVDPIQEILASLQLP